MQGLLPSPSAWKSQLPPSLAKSSPWLPHTPISPSTIWAVQNEEERWGYRCGLTLSGGAPLANPLTSLVLAYRAGRTHHRIHGKSWVWKKTIIAKLHVDRASLVVQMLKNSPAHAGDTGSIPGLGRSPGEGHGNHSSLLAWEIPWREEPDGLQSMGSQKSQTQPSN